MVEDEPPTVLVDREVTITYESRRLTVSPGVCVAKLGGPGVDFVVEGLDEDFSLEIDFRAQEGLKGPFLNARNPLRGRYVFEGGRPTRMPSGDVDRQRVTTASIWKYDVVVRQGNLDLAAIDPMIVLK